jgi:hypothetical protein
MAASTSLTSKTIFASLVAIGVAGAAQAQAPSTFDIAGQAPGRQVGNIEGGGSATLSGGGDNMTITYSAPGAGGGGGGVLSQSGRFARFASTHGDGLLVEYGAPAASADPGREAWLTGGGDNAEVVYASPHRRR